MKTKRKTICFFLFLITLIFVSCHSEKDSITNELRKIIGKKISFPQEMVLFNLPDSLDKSFFDKADYKILVFVDSAVCSECKIKSMLPWNEYFTIFNGMHVPVMVIINTGDIIQFKKSAEDVNITFPYFYDINGTFKSLNYVPSEELLRTFLMKNDTVLVVGDPLYNKKIFELYMKKISD